MKKILLSFLLISFVFLQANEEEIKIEPIRYKMESLSSRIAQSSKIFLLNFAFDELKESIKIDMKDIYIKAIIIKDSFLDEYVIIANKDEKGEVGFFKEVPSEITNLNYIKKDIIEKKEYTQTKLGELSIYYKSSSNDLSISNVVAFDKYEKKYLEKKQFLKMCVDPNWMPFEKIENGKHTGIASDYMKLFSKIIDTPIKLINTKTWNESLNKIKNKECDIISMAVKTNEREKYLSFSKPYLSTPNVIATKIGIPFIDDIKNIKNKRLGVVKGYSLHEILKVKYPNINLVEVDSITDGLEKVKKGEIFGYIDNSVVINYHIQESFLGILTVVGKLKESEILRVAIRDDELVLKGIFDKAIDLLDEKLKNEILNKWVKINYTVKTDYSLLWKVALASLLIVLIIVYWNRKLARLNKQLSLQRDKANIATKAKSDFLANMSHEIRTPMNGIVGMTELALKADLNDEGRKYIQKIEKSSKILLQIINDILDFSKIEANKLNIEKSSFNLIDTVNSVIDILEFKVKEKNLEFIKDINISKEDYFLGDSLRVSQIISNLLSNAIKFTSTGYIKIKIEQKEDEKVLFCLEDSGIGLSNEEQEKLFKPFTQADSTITKKYGGTGLGLAISKQLIDAMDGKIWLESKKDVGSKFFFELILKKVDKKDSVIEKEQNYEEDFNGMKILLVEDNLINQEIVLGLLADKNLKIDVANNGLEATQIYKNKENSYDLILMDIQMPVMDGIEATNIIKNELPHLPIIALSANILQENNDKYTIFDDYLTKPIKIKDLLKVLSKYYQNSTLN